MAYDKGSRVILLTHRSKIFKSTLSHLGNAGVPCVDFTAGKRMPPGDWRVMLAMERSLWNVIKKSPDSILQPNLLLVDEIHLKNFCKIIDFFKSRGKIYVVAFSGTPRGKHLHKYFTAIISNVDSADLIKSGDLARCRAYQAQDKEVDLVKKDKGEFDNKELFKHYNTAKRYEGLIREYNEKVKGLKGIVFCCNIEHTVKTYELFKESGVNAFMVHSGNKTYKMSEDEKERMINGFEQSSDGVMINQGILDTGYDHAPMMWVAVDRATTSLQLWLQMASRPATPYPGKKEYILLDFGMNHNRHGLVHQSRIWTLDPPKKRLKVESAPVKNCPQCSAMVYATAKVCEFCEYVFPIIVNELREGIMIEIKSGCPIATKGKRISELSIDELMQLEKVKKYKSSFIWRCVRTRGEESLKEYAEKKGYKPGWMFNQMKEIHSNNVGFNDYILK